MYQVPNVHYELQIRGYSMNVGLSLTSMRRETQGSPHY